ncbi:MAG: DegT/DnrJ/EryC1/StrS family aminotransferase [Myxococcota bacterium]
MKVPLLDLRRDTSLDPALTAAFTRVLESGRYILGPEVERFETACAEKIGVEHAIGVSSGTDALLLALMALDIGPGDEVLCPTYTFFSTAGSVARLGATPVFVDCDLWTFNVDPVDLERRVTKRTKAMIPVHLFGRCADMDAVLAVARASDIPVIEDAAQSLGSTTRLAGEWRHAGAMGDFGTFSFYPSKNLPAMGDAGLVTVASDELADKARILRLHGAKPKYHHRLVGGNFRIDALQAALIGTRLPTMDEAAAQRRQNAARYTERFLARRVAAIEDEAAIVLPAITEGHVVNQFVVRFPGEERDRVRQHLKDRGVGSEVYYPVPMHLQDCFAPFIKGDNRLPHAERCARETLALPVFPGLREDEIDYVVDTLVDAVS